VLIDQPTFYEVGFFYALVFQTQADRFNIPSNPIAIQIQSHASIRCQQFGLV